VKGVYLKRFLLTLSIFTFVCSLSGCATLGYAVSGLTQIVTTAIVLPFKLVGKVLDVVKTMPKPPPGVF